MSFTKFWPWASNEQGTVVEEAKVHMKKATRKHEAAVTEFAEKLHLDMKPVIIAAADNGLGRIEWNMSMAPSYISKNRENKHFLLGQTHLSNDDWKRVFEILVESIKKEPDLRWKSYDSQRPSYITLIWEH